MGTSQNNGAPRNNGQPDASKAAGLGLDPQGEMRVGDTYTLAIRGDEIEIRSSHDGGRTKTVPFGEFETAITEKWFGEY